MDENQLWDVRTFVYRHFAETTRPPSVEETASRFKLIHEEAASAYERLHQRHAIFLKPGTREVLMANPFSGVETRFKVHANDKTYFANCAWDSFGIPAALHVDAKIEAVCAQSGAPVDITVRNRQVQGRDVLVHFLVPFKNWYDDLPFT
jgi:DNA-binding transcriptional MocR family regulator